MGLAAPSATTGRHHFCCVAGSSISGSARPRRKGCGFDSVSQQGLADDPVVSHCQHWNVVCGLQTDVDPSWDPMASTVSGWKKPVCERCLRYKVDAESGLMTSLARQAAAPQQLFLSPKQARLRVPETLAVGMMAEPCLVWQPCRVMSSPFLSPMERSALEYLESSTDS